MTYEAGRGGDGFGLQSQSQQRRRRRHPFTDAESLSSLAKAIDAHSLEGFAIDDGLVLLRHSQLSLQGRNIID